MKKPSPVKYITNDEIYPDLAVYVREYRAAKAAGLPQDEFPRIPDSVGRAILLISQKLATKGNFSGYSFVQDMIGDGYENCIRYIHNFDPDKSKNPFAYITLIIHRAFVRRIQKEQSHSYIRHKLILSNSDVIDMMAEEGADLPALGSINMGKSSDIVEQYEKRLEDKKEKVRRNKQERS